MPVVAMVLVGLIALLHIYIAWFEMFAWESRGPKVFRDFPKDLFAQTTSQQELLQLFREDIIPKAQQALEQSISAYQVGKVDFQQMIDNWRDLLRFEITAQRIEAGLRQSLASLARAVGAVELGGVVETGELVPLPPSLPAEPQPELSLPSGVESAIQNP